MIKSKGKAAICLIPTETNQIIIERVIWIWWVLSTIASRNNKTEDIKKYGEMKLSYQILKKASADSHLEVDKSLK